MAGTLERGTSLILSVSALFFVALLAKRELFDVRSGRALPRQASGPPERVRNWDELRSHAIPVQFPRSKVTVMEFADLECPACKQFHTRLKQTAAELGADVGLFLIHYPLSTHRFAKLAARALECADAQGGAARFTDVAYAKQDSFGLKPWTEYASEAGISDTTRFSICVRDTSQIQRIEEGRRLGEEMKLQGTPVVMVNGWRFQNVPNDTELKNTIQKLMIGESPLGMIDH